MNAKKHDVLQSADQNHENHAQENETQSDERNLFSVDLDFLPGHSVQLQIRTEIRDRADRIHSIWAGVGRRK